MERKKFLKSLSLFAVATPSVLASCKKDTGVDDVYAGTDVEIDGSCVVSPPETEGPFPTKSPSSLERSNIIDGKTGAKMSANITVVNSNSDCIPVEGAIVDIWHCDVDGNYSQYGNTQMQRTDFTDVYFFRGRQVSDGQGLVTFQTIFPGWYQSRATHIHVHIFNSSGKSLLVTQIAFPDDLSATVNSTGAAYGYTKGMSGYTYNARDNVFHDSVSRQMSTITGSLATGFDLSITIRVNA